MQEFLKAYSTQMALATQRAAAELSVPASEQTRGHRSFTEVMAFLNVERDCISSIKAEFATQDFFDKAAIRFYKGRFRRELPKTPKTVADDMVGYIMQTAFGYAAEEALTLEVAHQRAMAAENAVGDVLERYIASVLEPKGWTWCSGTLVSAIDFVHYNVSSESWDVLQIKNRDNSENSSSAGYRSGRGIPSWFRTFSRTGLTNWNAFPILSGSDKHLLSETGFKEFVRNFYQPLRELACAE